MLQAIPVARPAVASADELDAFLGSSADWGVEDGVLVRRATAPTFAAGIHWVTQVAEVAERSDHHPDIDIRWRTVVFRLSTHDAGGITVLDFALAHAIDDVVGREAESEPSA